MWTSLAHVADWCFVVARTEPGSKRHHGLSYLLVPMDQEGVEVRPIIQLDRHLGVQRGVLQRRHAPTPPTSSASEGDGWKVAMATLGFERGVSTLGQQVGFQRELDALLEVARGNGTLRRPGDPRPAGQGAGRARGDPAERAAHPQHLRARTRHPSRRSIAKLLWAGWHRTLGELAMQVRGADSLTTGPDYDLDEWQRLFLFTRADTIYGGSDEIQRNVLAERVLGLPREQRSEAR